MNVDDPSQPGITTRRSGDVAGAKPGSTKGRLSDLKPFADQLMAIAQQLRSGDFPTAPTKPESLPIPASAESSTSMPSSAKSDQRRVYARLARKEYATRRERESIFNQAELFGEPAWDILLDLYVAYVDDKAVSVSSACIGSASPPTTGLRWLGVLAENEMIIREPDPVDQRRVLVRLTERSIEVMDRYFASVGGSS